MKTIKISMSEFKDWVSIQQGEFTGFPKFALCDFLGIKRFGNSIEELEDFIPFGSMGIFYHIAKIDWYN